MSMNEDRFIQRDRMRFTKNTLSSGLALLAILFNVLYFVSIYKSDVGSYYYNIRMGASVLYNLLFMLVVFLCSEGVKSYKSSFAWVLLVIGALQSAHLLPAAHGPHGGGHRQQAEDHRHAERPVHPGDRVSGGVGRLLPAGGDRGHPKEPRPGGPHGRPGTEGRIRGEGYGNAELTAS